jgi:hypothetical protein
MSRLAKATAHSADQGNLAFVELVDQLSELGVSQQELAGHLGISPG